MKALTIATTVGIIIFTASEENLPEEKVYSAAMNFELRHLSITQCDSMNYIVGRQMKWIKNDESLIETTVTVNTDIGDHEKPAVQKTPAWVSEIVQKGETYQIEKKQRAKKYQDRLSDYSQTELSIAKNMGLNPWDIDREQLRLWGQETDTILLKL
jgi:hypothetical protein